MRRAQRAEAADQRVVADGVQRIQEMELAPGEQWGTMCAVAETLADVDEARRVSHDQLIAQMGGARTGGVRWLTFGRKEGVAIARREQMWDVAEHLAKWPCSVLVMALAPGQPNEWMHE